MRATEHCDGGCDCALDPPLTWQLIDMAWCEDAPPAANNSDGRRRTPPPAGAAGNDHPQQSRGRRHSRPRSRSAADENMGRIVDVLVDRSGQVRAAIIDFGGFLGVGSRKIAVDWNALHFPQPGKPGEQDRARTDARSGQGRARISGGQTGRRPRRARQARAAAFE